ncbi:MAG: hypothetical protein ACRDG5_12055, partial [Anaerolineales bacterium]
MPRLTWCMLTALSAVAVGLVLFSTSSGAGISPDSVQYIASARSVLEGTGLPLELWAPLYPVVLAAGARAGLEILFWARLLNVILLAANLFLAGLIIARHHPSSRFAPLIGPALLLISQNFVAVHAWIWTEPLALFTGFLGLYWLDRVWEEPKATALIPPALVLGLSCLIRYASLPFVAAGVLGLVVLGRGGPARAKSIRAGVFAAASLLPIAIWSQYLLSQTGRVAGRSIQFRPSALAELEGGLRIAADWILPGRVQGEAIRTWAGAAFLLAWAGGAIAVMVYRNRTGKVEVSADVPHAADLLTLFVLAYAVMIVGTRFFLTPSVAVSHRIFSLAYAAMVVAAVGYARELLPSFRDRAGDPVWRRWAVAGVLAVLLVPWTTFQFTHTAKW